MLKAKRHCIPGWGRALLYKAFFRAENGDIGLENTYSWEITVD
jgi:hypothetical protein